MKTVGITALVPPELVFACGFKPFDLNNIVPTSDVRPRNKLCAWTAIWREEIMNGKLDLDSLVVVAGGDCHNALVDGERAAEKIPAFYLFYPFDGDKDYLKSQFERLSSFLGGIIDPEMMKTVKNVKKELIKLDQMRVRGMVSSELGFQYLISGSDLQGDPTAFREELSRIPQEKGDRSSMHRVALLGVPPIHHDFHREAEKLGLHIAFDEMPFEFIRHTGASLNELARDYADYTFARELKYRFNFLEEELKRRRVDAIIHCTQFACHHTLEDGMLREYLQYPTLTVHSDLPGPVPEQLKLRLEAFSEILWRRR
ncbi:2-hydroxyglutaryl-CoA dehydratase, D-component [Candidatus Methanoperedenaceae archaeon GB37]|nr:2-hydroxyglutaryl-CoA dehydratase, D-component [Candidatus Methanoperedenaceae archaeon GB37]